MESLQRRQRIKKSNSDEGKYGPDFDLTDGRNKQVGSLPVVQMGLIQCVWGWTDKVGERVISQDRSGVPHQNVSSTSSMGERKWTESRGVRRRT